MWIISFTPLSNCIRQSSWLFWHYCRASKNAGYCHFSSWILCFCRQRKQEKHHQGICLAPSQCWSRTTSQCKDNTSPLPEAACYPALSKWGGRTQGCFIRSSERWGLGYQITDLLKSEQRDFPGHPGIKTLLPKWGAWGQSLVGKQRSHVLPGS